MSVSSNSWIKKWLWSGIVLIILMMMVGAITRLTGSGLSIVEWKVISGIIPPFTAEDWNLTFLKYKQFPQYQKLNHNFDVEDFKRIFWWEYIHRLLGRIVGLAFIIPFAVIVTRKHVPRWLKVRLVVILFAGICQGIMGWLMVKSGLVDMPHVNHFRLALHLSFAFGLIALILWLIFDLEHPPGPALKWKFTAALLPAFCLVVVVIQIILGVLVAGLKAGFSYNTFPMMEGRFFPDAINSQASFLYNGVALQFIHRWFAWFALACVVWLWIEYRRRSGALSSPASPVNLLLFVVIIQLVIGILTLVLNVPIVLAVLHQMTAVLAFGLLLNLTYLAGYRLD
ncbi:MAG TPA: COX15/CtaA family protein [Cyclobacteriaceae bacterium]|jgi:heme a synthase|nr:COX15/CtaA family protein [Cyclobacteriaceae bacterium]HMV10535.1 COX15/CtaA family protein [Cyclobacteriaceae bacterium]HMV89611.1 COX15/CtaA family protein [Cyclobacteriaceae bacterium]HMW99453.1 COX15/CtaA family protein [Cyclobacteriaceae bacterium]HMX48758.1 COX15/CtaA family protein [Cyclobacteriaceae bacterium]